METSRKPRAAPEARQDAFAALWTADQVEMELRAAELFRRPEIAQALVDVRRVALSMPQVQLPSGAATLDRSMAELAFAYLLRNLNADAAHPRILWDQNAPHRVAGCDIPGSRCTGNNPDNIYRRVPLEPGGRYEIRGRRTGPMAADVTFSVLPDVAHQEGWRQVMLPGAALPPGDGDFTITLDAAPDDGRPGHMRLAPGAARLTVRESMIDWAAESPLALEVVRLDCPDVPATDVGAVVRKVAAGLPGFARHWLGFNNRTFYAGAPNTFGELAAPPGGLTSQIAAMGHFALRGDEALVIRAERLDAAYSAFQVMDPWMFGAEYRDRTGSLNHGQATPDPDGAYTFVLSAEDVGAPNWLDSEGLLQGAMQMRWQGLPQDRPPALDSAIRARVVKLADVAAELGRASNASARRRRLAEREAAHARRFLAAPDGDNQTMRRRGKPA